MRRIINTLLLVVVLIATLVLMGPTGVGSQTTYPLEECARGCFSTEEDFMMMKGEPYDGNPYISDGDLLSFTGRVCARNADLLSRFYDGRPPADLGLDAVDILHVKDRIIAFSTELDDPRGRFTAGDLLFTPGYFIPNRALVYPFGITHDIGLDALQFRGPEDKVLAFVRSIPNLCANGWPGCLQSQLKERGIDIWFSVEGTVIRAGAPSILDGYVLSAAYGTIIAKQDALLPNVVPADIPQRGVDLPGRPLCPRDRHPRAAHLLFHRDPLPRRAAALHGWRCAPQGRRRGAQERGRHQALLPRGQLFRAGRAGCGRSAS
ncbi:MAG: hypothetical protein FJZ90_14135 [Chloroflexi bacterium]|nr:hypothetical protein [Chloroflexota bacterium]